MTSRGNTTKRSGHQRNPQKVCIIETVARRIKSDIKAHVPSVTEEYPHTSELNMNESFQYLPSSPRLLLSKIFVGMDINRKSHVLVSASFKQHFLEPLLRRFKLDLLYSCITTTVRG